MELIAKLDDAILELNEIVNKKDKLWYEQINILPKQFSLFLDDLESMKNNINSRNLYSPHFIPYIITDQWIEKKEVELQKLLLGIVSDYRNNK